MNKEMFRDVCISCSIFLLLIYGISLWIENHYVYPQVQKQSVDYDK